MVGATFYSLALVSWWSLLPPKPRGGKGPSPSTPPPSQRLMLNGGSRAARPLTVPWPGVALPRMGMQETPGPGAGPPPPSERLCHRREFREALKAGAPGGHGLRPCRRPTVDLPVTRVGPITRDPRGAPGHHPCRPPSARPRPPSPRPRLPPWLPTTPPDPGGMGDRDAVDRRAGVGRWCGVGSGVGPHPGGRRRAGGGVGTVMLELSCSRGPGEADPPSSRLWDRKQVERRALRGGRWFRRLPSSREHRREHRSGGFPPLPPPPLGIRVDPPPPAMVVNRQGIRFVRRLSAEGFASTLPMGAVGPGDPGEGGGPDAVRIRGVLLGGPGDHPSPPSSTIPWWLGRTGPGPPSISVVLAEGTRDLPGGHDRIGSPGGAAWIPPIRAYRLTLQGASGEGSSERGQLRLRVWLE